MTQKKKLSKNLVCHNNQQTTGTVYETTEKVYNTEKQTAFSRLMVEKMLAHLAENPEARMLSSNDEIS